MYTPIRHRGKFRKSGYDIFSLLFPSWLSKRTFGTAGGVGLFRSRRDIAIRNQESDQTINLIIKPGETWVISKRFVVIKMFSGRKTRMTLILNFAFFCFLLVNWNHFQCQVIFYLKQNKYKNSFFLLFYKVNLWTANDDRNIIQSERQCKRFIH